MKILRRVLFFCVPLLSRVLVPPASHGLTGATLHRLREVSCSNPGAWFVRCQIRNPSLSAFETLEVAAEFTHHQKTVRLDACIPGSENHEILSFVGEIDLCDGRFDDEIHLLFS